MRILVLGAGVVGLRATRQLLTVPDVSDIVLVGRDSARTAELARQMGGIVRSVPDRAHVDADVVVLTTPAGHAEAAAWALANGSHVVSASDALTDADQLLALDAAARAAGRTLAIGVGFAPGLTCVLARHATAEFDTVDEVHVAKVGTGGPACARQHHQALGSDGRDWRNGAWVVVRGGSGRELVWFPDPIGGADCYRAALSDAVLLQPAFPQASRITARVSATRRDRLTAVLPMLRKPHPEAGAGAVRVEVRGRRGGVARVVAMGAMDRPSIAAGAVIATTADAIVHGRMLRTGAGGLAELVNDTAAFLAELARRGVKAARFEGMAERSEV
jgi:saccharopine dehydrogenase-like NADP-dependent oxidoreductase